MLGSGGLVADHLRAPLQVGPDRPRPFVVPILSRLRDLAHVKGQHARMIVDDDVPVSDGQQSNVVRAVVEQVARDMAAAAERPTGKGRPCHTGSRVGPEEKTITPSWLVTASERFRTAPG